MPVSSLTIIYASTSGHTEYVLGIVRDVLEREGVKVSLTRVERAEVSDFGRGDAILLASGTWNTGGIEGQLNPHMHEFLRKRATDVSLKGRKVVVIGLGDTRYRYTCRAADHLEEFAKSHGGDVIATLRIVNEPYGQEGVVQDWAKKLLSMP